MIALIYSLVYLTWPIKLHPAVLFPDRVQESEDSTVTVQSQNALDILLENDSLDGLNDFSDPTQVEIEDYFKQQPTHRDSDFWC